VQEFKEKIQREFASISRHALSFVHKYFHQVQSLFKAVGQNLNSSAI
jgi:hypothetical protein